MPHLKDLLGGPSERANVVADCLELLDAEVKDKSGLSGMAIKAGFSVVKGIKPTFIKETIEHLLPDFCDKLDPIYQEAVASDQGLEAHLVASKSRIADALLAITDKRAQGSKHGSIVKTYEKLRPTAKSNVEAAIPRLAKLIKKYSPA
jgi:hypothetical protein